METTSNSYFVTIQHLKVEKMKFETLINTLKFSNIIISLLYSTTTTNYHKVLISEGHL